MEARSQERTSIRERQSPVMVGMCLRGLTVMMGCRRVMRVGKMRMVRGLLVIARAMMYGRLIVMFRGMFVMFRGVSMMLGSLLRV